MAKQEEDNHFVQPPPHFEPSFDNEDNPENDLKFETVQLETDDRVIPDIVSRADWGAARPRATMATTFPFTKVFFTLNTGTEECYNKEECTRVVQQMQKHHMQTLNLADIKYNFLVAGDGTIYEGRGWNVRSSKSMEFNPHFYDFRLDIAYIGDFRGRNPPNPQLEAALELVTYGEFLKHIHITRDFHSLNGEKDGDWSKWPPKPRPVPDEGGDLSEIIGKVRGKGQVVDNYEYDEFPIDYEGI